jgi:hypothetical protein
VKSFRLFLEGDGGKQSKASVDYTDHASNHDERCELCKHFRLTAPDFETAKCAIVEGIIDADGWCKEFEKD